MASIRQPKSEGGDENPLKDQGLSRPTHAPGARYARPPKLGFDEHRTRLRREKLGESGHRAPPCRQDRRLRRAPDRNGPTSGLLCDMPLPIDEIAGCPTCRRSQGHARLRSRRDTPCCFGALAISPNQELRRHGLLHLSAGEGHRGRAGDAEDRLFERFPATRIRMHNTPGLRSQVRDPPVHYGGRRFSTRHTGRGSHGARPEDRSMGAGASHVVTG